MRSEKRIVGSVVLGQVVAGFSRTGFRIEHTVSQERQRVVLASEDMLEERMMSSAGGADT